MNEEVGRIDGADLGNTGGVVVVELVVIPGDEPRATPMHFLEVPVGTVEGVAAAVVFEGDDAGLGGPGVAADLFVLGGAFVNVVAEVEDEIRVILGHALIGRVVAVFVMLARGEGETQFAR